MTKRIAVLTSGGDCAGLNAAIRAVVLHANTIYGWEVIGIEDGTRGVMERPMRVHPLAPSNFDGHMLRRAGTMLGSVSTGDPFAFPSPHGPVDRSEEIVTGLKDLGIDGLIGIGGDGSMQILDKIMQRADLPFVGIPKTIDNDVFGTDTTIGFDTAVTVAVEALDRLHPTAQSHNRVMILEVMGRDAGHIATHAAVAGGADVCLIPEFRYSIDGVVEAIQSVGHHGRRFSLIVVAEATPKSDGTQAMRPRPGGGERYGGIGEWIGDELEKRIGADVRVTTLGHVQRGAEPNAADRVLASALGVHAVDLMAKGKTGRVAVWRNRGVGDVSIEDVVSNKRPVSADDIVVRTALGLGIYLGDVPLAHQP
ncbi:MULTISPECIES: ATP-dependent 6-phosphofructokinase [Thalassobaculum]|uniref:ATP-dependent 6-phosphofructokinase n=1 Tax=Thalassobaculum litoreum DSM 18839 TaxID=1123362 RepID=A0A8G2BF41_9PROT|nr:MULTISPECIES: ATP-dependent 6-phosphofructokinase [Thalassobaculum]SDF29361.1 6-phosphofructokinase 1 [Thalassobaculum litoreum DSM 18839]